MTCGLSNQKKIFRAFCRIRLKFTEFSYFEVLDARFTKSSPGAAVDLKDKTPQYAPKTITRTGLIYKKENRLKAALMGVMVTTRTLIN
jgi:hypothetical protein